MRRRAALAMPTYIRNEREVKIEGKGNAGAMKNNN